MKYSLNIIYLKMNLVKAISQPLQNHKPIILWYLLMHISTCYIYKYVSYDCLNFICMQCTHTNLHSSTIFFTIFFFDNKYQLSLSHHFPSCTFKFLIGTIFLILLFNKMKFVNFSICDREIVSWIVYDDLTEEEKT